MRERERERERERDGEMGERERESKHNRHVLVVVCHLAVYPRDVHPRAVGSVVDSPELRG